VAETSPGLRDSFERRKHGTELSGGARRVDAAASMELGTRSASRPSTTPSSRSACRPAGRRTSSACGPDRCPAAGRPGTGRHHHHRRRVVCGFGDDTGTTRLCTHCSRIRNVPHGPVRSSDGVSSKKGRSMRRRTAGTRVLIKPVLSAALGVSVALSASMLANPLPALAARTPEISGRRGLPSSHDPRSRGRPARTQRATDR
jgi:hypothetical protein